LKKKKFQKSKSVTQLSPQPNPPLEITITKLNQEDVMRIDVDPYGDIDEKELQDDTLLKSSDIRYYFLPSNIY